MNSSRWVACVVQRAATLSPSAIMSCTTLTVSGKAVSHSDTDRLMFSSPDRLGYEGLWST